MTYDDGEYKPVTSHRDVDNTIYFTIESTRFPGAQISLSSSKPFFLFINGQLAARLEGHSSFSVDSLMSRYSSSSLIVSIYQPNINLSDLNTAVVLSTPGEASNAVVVDQLKPTTFFRDFVIVSSLFITIIFLLVININPKLASDYFSVTRIFSLRDTDDAHSSTRLAAGADFQFYLVCSLLIGFYIMIVSEHLPTSYLLPLYFKGTSFWSCVVLWLKCSVIILAILLLRIVLIYTLTRLFGLKGLGRVHFFNWLRLILVVLGTASVVLFAYFILRGQNIQVFEIFMSLIVGVLTAWIIIAFLKLNGKTEHAMFHLFSYICATEIIPLLITFKVLFH